MVAASLLTFRALVAMILLGAASSTTVLGQINWGFGPTMQLVVTNTTQMHVEILVNGRREVILRPSETRQVQWIEKRGSSVEYTVVANICTGLVRTTTVPQWAMDQDRWGSTAAIHESYLESSPTENDLKRRVDSLKKALDGSKVMGRQNMKKELDRWFGNVRKTGGFFIMLCSEKIATTRPHRDSIHVQPGQFPVISLSINETRGRYDIRRD